MAIHLHENEKIQIKADFHWWSYKFSLFWAGFCVLASVANLIGTETTAGHTFGQRLHDAFFALLVGLIPIGIRFIQNMCKQYLVTTERFYVEEGVLSKRMRDIPISKINDVELNQDIFQRMVGTGNVIVLTGNDLPTVIRNITNPESFKNKLSQLSRQYGKAA